MGRFEPSADPRDAVERGFYVPRPGRSIAEQLAARFEVKPSASHLLVGGVGSGKTTQLLVARRKLEAALDVCTIYVDVSRSVDPATIEGAALLAIVGRELISNLSTAHQEAFENALKRFNLYISNGHIGVYADPFNILVRDIIRIREALIKRFPHCVLLVDALDRMSDLENFSRIVESAVTTLRSLGLGIVLIGPLTALYGIERIILDRFDRVWHLPSVDVQDDEQGRDFLRRVLRARDTENLVSDTAAEKLIRLSGGVLRDLMTLAQISGEEAYVDGAERVEPQHVDIAADAFGRKHLVAIDSEQLAVLQGVRTKGTFVQTSEKHLALLATRRVLEYMNGQPHFAVHPTIEPLLAQIAPPP
jgi:hypothetical protein